MTGGASGIGASIVEHFAAQGSQVAFVDILGEEGRALAERLTAPGAPSPRFFRCDVREVETLQAVIARVADEIGPPAVLVSNAANDDRHPVETVTPAYWRDRLAVNLDHCFFAAQAVRGPMRKRGGGSIVNLGSIVWKIALAGLPGYLTAKAAISGLSRGLAREFGPDGIRVNTVLPGAVHTPRQLALWLTDQDIAAILRLQCLEEPLLPSDVARMALFLAADDSRMCTAQEFVVDGGWS